MSEYVSVYCTVCDHGNYLRQGGNVFARLCLSVSLSVCESAR